MNLCGGIGNVSGHEKLALEIPDERFQMTPRRKASSSTPSYRKKTVQPGAEIERRRTPSSTRASSRGRSGQPPTPFNSGAVQRSRKQNNPTTIVSKSSTKLIAKLEAGFEVVSFSIHVEHVLVYVCVLHDSLLYSGFAFRHGKSQSSS